MPNSSRPRGRWTQHFDADASFEDEAQLAAPVDATASLHSIEGFEDRFSYVDVVFSDLPGRDEPLWASDHEWLYLRRPEGVWKTKLPRQHLGRICRLFQLRESVKRYGGAQLGREFNRQPGWKRLGKPITPAELDFPYGVDDAGNEIGPMLSHSVEATPGRLVLSAGSEFAEPPIAWALLSDRLLATDRSGRVVAYPIAPHFDIPEMARMARRQELWLRFWIWSHPWADPIDAQVRL